MYVRKLPSYPSSPFFNSPSHIPIIHQKKEKSRYTTALFHPCPYIKPVITSRTVYNSTLALFEGCPIHPHFNDPLKGLIFSLFHPYGWCSALLLRSVQFMDHILHLISDTLFTRDIHSLGTRHFMIVREGGGGAEGLMIHLYGS